MSCSNSSLVSNSNTRSTYRAPLTLLRSSKFYWSDGPLMLWSSCRIKTNNELSSLGERFTNQGNTVPVMKDGRFQPLFQTVFDITSYRSKVLLISCPFFYLENFKKFLPSRCSGNCKSTIGTLSFQSDYLHLWNEIGTLVPRSKIPESLRLSNIHVMTSSTWMVHSIDQNPQRVWSYLQSLFDAKGTDGDTCPLSTLSSSPGP